MRPGPHETNLRALGLLSSLSHGCDLGVEVVKTFGLTPLTEVVALVTARARGSR